MSIDWSKPVRHAKSHDHVRVLCTDRPNIADRFPVVLMSLIGDILSCDINGKVMGEQIYENIPETVEVDIWINVYDTGCAWPHRTRAKANSVAGAGTRIACINVKRTVEVGEGLNK